MPAPARDRLLVAAAELFYASGVGATGIDAITAHAGVAKKSLYNNFASKAHLVEAYLQRRIDDWHLLLAERLDAASTPAERALAVFDSYVDHAALAKSQGFRGCGLLNAAAELPADDSGRKLVAKQKAEVEALFRDALTDLDSAHDVADVAEHLTFLLEGAMALAGLDGSDARLRSARRIAVSVLGSV